MNPRNTASTEAVAHRVCYSRVRNNPSQRGSQGERPFRASADRSNGLYEAPSRAIIAGWTGVHFR